MSNLGLDKYGFQARLRPALLSLFPVFVTVAVWAPALYEIAGSLVGLAVACGLMVACSHFARMRGRTIQDRLVKEWGGLPTTLWLRQSDAHLEIETKQRYFDFFEKNVPNWIPPTPEEEAADPDRADSRYASAVRWLLEYTRDTKQYPLVFTENISYGFRRNALGLKSVAIILALASIGYSAGMLYGATLGAILANQFPQLAVGVVSFLLLLWWTFGVTKSWVRDAADAYAKALLSACDAP